ncbi:MAG: right-handed parallel beta-helix repeat-containing protein [Bacteroidales bacterium]|nr:right-handed parallel beta-helix repeat-containing protein [Bacteroidales bacterium]
MNYLKHVTNNLKVLFPLTIVLLTLSIAMTSCEEEDNGVSTTITLTADAGSDMTVSVGEEVVLDGSNSSASEGSFDYEWTFTATPNGSSAQLNGATTASPSFAADVEGDYVVELTITNGNESDTDEVTVTATEGSNQQPKEVSDDVETNKTWTDRVSDPNTPDYIVTSNISVKAELTIEAGVTVHFDEDVFMTANEGVIMAEGNASSRITLTSSNEAGDIHWGGIMIKSSDSRNALIYTDIMYAGGAQMDFADFVDKKAAVGISGDGKLKLNYSNINNNDGYGLYVRYGVLVEFESNTFEDNSETAIGVDMTQAAMIDANTTFTNNEYQVEIFGSSSTDGEALTYIDLSGDASYYVTGALDVSADLTINSGAHFMFKENQKLTVTSEGMLKANAEGGETIVFTSAEASSDIHWKGIQIKSSDSQNALVNVEISYAGNSNWDFADFKDIQADLALTSDGKVKLRNSVISNSAGYGLYLRYGVLAEFESNTFSDNNDIAIGLNADQAASIDANTSFSGNGWDGVEIYLSDLTEASTWVNLQGNAQYRVTGNLTVKEALTINPGAYFAFEEDKKLKVDSDGGSLSAEGTSSSKIIFTSSNTAGGILWSGLHIRSASSLNTLDYVEVMYAGGTEHDLDNFVDAATAISGHGNAVMTLTNSKVGYSGGYGVYWQGTGTINDILSASANNEFVGNVNGNVLP